MLHKNLYLIGFMGSGKSTIAKVLASLTRADCIEMDQAIEKSRNMTISSIFEKYGEESFRDSETQLIKDLSQKENQIVSCGGGAVLRPENVAMMKNSGRIILLTASPQTIWKRVRYSTKRPILNGHMEPDYISRLMEKRQPAYQSAADLTVNTDGKKPKAIAEEILDLL